MADKPIVDVSWATTTLYPDGTPTIVEPSAGEKAAGQGVGAPVLAQYLNFLFNGIWQWIVWLMNFESTAHTWTAQQTFTGTTLFSAGTGALAGPGAQGFLATGETNTSTNGSARGGIGGQATGGNATAGTGAGGDGLKGTGGIPFNGGIPGNGVFGVGATINGATDSVSQAGKGGRFVGGSVSSDTAGRTGGNALDVTAGLGQNGYGDALHADHGSLQLDDGDVVVSGGDVIVSGNVEAPVAIFTSIVGTNTGFAPAAVAYAGTWLDNGGGYDSVKASVDPLGNKRLQGAAKNTASGTLTVTTLDSEFRPAVKRIFLVGSVTIVIDTTGVVTAGGYAGSSVLLPFDGITYT